MKTTRILIIILSTLFLISCKTKIICAQVRKNKIDHVPICDISFQFDRCRCRCFNLNDWDTVRDEKCGDDFVGGDFPVEVCEGIAGFYPSVMALELKPKIKDLARIRGDYCGFKK